MSLQANESLAYILSLPLHDYAVFYWDVDRVIEIYNEEVRYAIGKPLSREDAREVIAKIQELDISLGISDKDVVNLIEEVIGL